MSLLCCRYAVANLTEYRRRYTVTRPNVIRSNVGRANFHRDFVSPPKNQQKMGYNSIRFGTFLLKTRSLEEEIRQLIMKTS
jgi:hypothetical protein